MPGKWAKVAKSPGFATSTMLLLTDGSVMCQQSFGAKWSKLTPDATGNYVNGTWTPLAPMSITRLYYASAVLRDGRVIVCGGEKSSAGDDTNKCEMYDPVADTWTALAPPAGWTNIGDAVSCVLPDGRFMLGYYTGVKTAIFDPLTNAWSAGPNKGDSASEETWTLLGDQTVLTVQCNKRPYAEKYVAASNSWASAGKLPVDLVEAASTEIGPALLLPDHRVFCIGATKHTALYTPPAIASQLGTWAAGPDFPAIEGKTIGAKDAPACLMPNGKVLLVGGPVDGLAASYLPPAYFFEFDGTHLTQVTNPPGWSAATIPYVCRMLLSSTGQVLLAAGTTDLFCYTPDGQPQHAWKPVITNAPSFIVPGSSHTLFGTQLNGLSQAVSYGDDAQMATNYPIVRIVDPMTNKVYYCRTSGHSSMGVATGAAVHHTNFHVPVNVPMGDLDLFVVANGIPSDPVRVKSTKLIWPRVYDSEAWVWLIGSLADGPLWAWGPNGPVPVDPWGPKVVKDASAASNMMLDGMKQLQQIGAQIVTQREQAAAALPPAVDPKAISKDKDAGKKTVTKTKAKKK